jgi:hypothetical protein
MKERLTDREALEQSAQRAASSEHEHVWKDGKCECGLEHPVSSEPQKWTADSIVSAMLEEQKSNPAWSKAELWGIERDIVPLLRSRINAALATERRKVENIGALSKASTKAIFERDKVIASEQTVSKRLVEALEIGIQLIEALGIKSEELQADWGKTVLALPKEGDRITVLAYRFHTALTAVSAQLKRRLDV